MDSALEIFDILRQKYIDLQALCEKQEKEILDLRLKNSELTNNREKTFCENKLLDSNASNILLLIGQAQQEKEGNGNHFTGNRNQIIDNLKPNNKGVVGELLVVKYCKKCNIPCTLEGKNANDGVYDVKINNKRCEIKTACVGKSGTLQHESLRNQGCDFYIFVSIFPNYHYLTIITKFDLREKHAVLSVKAHLRKGSSDIYKLSFGEKHLTEAVKNNLSIKIAQDTSLFEIKNIIEFYTN